jgi:HlyD family secretion protein
MSKWHLRILIAGATIALLLYWAGRTYLAKPPSLLEASGTIETTEVDVSFQVAGRVERRLVDEGDKVGQGQILALLDEKPLKEALDRAAAQLDAAKTGVTQQRAALAWTRRTLEEQERAARAGMEAARARMQEVKTGPRIQETRQAESALEAAESSLIKAKLDADRARELVQKKVYSQAALDAAEALLSAARSERDRARESLNLMREGSRKEQIDAAEAQLRQASAQLSQAVANQIQIEMKEKDLAAAESHVRELQAACNIAQINLDYAKLKAPISGWVLLKNIEAGEVVNVGTPVVTLGDIEDLWMNVYVDERSVGRLKLGDPVEIQVDAHPKETFVGKIVFISQEAEFTPKNVQTRDERTKLVYRVKVSIRNQNQKLKPGMPADATLRLR